MTDITKILSAEEIQKYGGDSVCIYLYDCPSMGKSTICNLRKGYYHPVCPNRIAAKKLARKLMKTDPEFAEDYRLVEDEEYGGEGSCGWHDECNLFDTSKLCHLNEGYRHPECPSSIAIKEQMKKDKTCDP